MRKVKVTLDLFFFPRFIYLYYPIKAKNYCSQSIGRKVSFLIWIISIIYNIPRFFMYRVGDNNELIITAFGRGKFGQVRIPLLNYQF